MHEKRYEGRWSDESPPKDESYIPYVNRKALRDEAALILSLEERGADLYDEMVSRVKPETMKSNPIYIQVTYPKKPWFIRVWKALLNR